MDLTDASVLKVVKAVAGQTVHAEGGANRRHMEDVRIGAEHKGRAEAVREMFGFYRTDIMQVVNGHLSGARADMSVPTTTSRDQQQLQTAGAAVLKTGFVIEDLADPNIFNSADLTALFSERELTVSEQKRVLILIRAHCRSREQQQ